MNQDYNSYDNTYNEPTRASLAQIPSLQPITVSQGSSRMTRKMDNHVAVAAIKEQAKARLTGHLIATTTALSHLADTAISMVPSCEQPVRAIVNSHAYSSMNEIVKTAERWR